MRNQLGDSQPVACDHRFRDEIAFRYIAKEPHFCFFDAANSTATCPSLFVIAKSNAK